jgi:hypothetical protein
MRIVQNDLDKVAEKHFASELAVRRATAKALRRATAKGETVRRATNT